MDPRLLFYNPDWQGFDIVIGNPPYERYSKEPRRRSRAQLKAQGYATTRGNDLYNLVSEAALTLVKPSGGVITLVVPLSISFGQDQADTRRLFERRAAKIQLRHQDNRPDKTFHASPVSNPENRQRTTIITAVAGPGAPRIFTTGANKWRSSERDIYLASRRYASVPSKIPAMDVKLSGQWPRVPTPEVALLIETMGEQRTTIAGLATLGDNQASVAIPKTAYEFITATPTGMLKRRENPIPIKDADALELAIAALNGHAAFAWWRAYGDAFDVRVHELAAVAIPDKWLDDAVANRAARALGRQLILSINADSVEAAVSGTAGRTFENVNFHKACPAAVARIDRLYLAALNVPQDPLLPQLRAMRSNSNWRL